jgi:hypothetical protein
VARTAVQLIKTALEEERYRARADGKYHIIDCVEIHGITSLKCYFCYAYYTIKMYLCKKRNHKAKRHKKTAHRVCDEP